MNPNCPTTYENMGELIFEKEAHGIVVPKQHLSLDAQCIKVKNSKKTKKKMREVFDLGKKKEDFVYPVELVVIRIVKLGRFRQV